MTSQIQFVVCSNGVSGTIGEHSMMDALTVDELHKSIADAISSHSQADVGLDHTLGKPTISPVPLPFTTESDKLLENHMSNALIQYADSFKEAEHVYLLFDGFGSRWLRSHKLSPNSVFQMVVQLAAYATFGYTPPCWETVNLARYHLGRFDIIQVITPPVAAFLEATRDSSVGLAELHILLVAAIRSHVSTMNKAGQNLGWERQLTVLSVLLDESDGEQMTSLYNDPVYRRVRPRVMMSNCFQTGMLEKDCQWKDPEAVWSHYEVYDDR